MVSLLTPLCLTLRLVARPRPHPTGADRNGADLLVDAGEQYGSRGQLGPHPAFGFHRLKGEVGGLDADGVLQDAALVVLGDAGRPGLAAVVADPVPGELARLGHRA